MTLSVCQNTSLSNAAKHERIAGIQRRTPAIALDDAESRDGYGAGVASLIMPSEGPTRTTSPPAGSSLSFRISPLILPGM
jgi:hypothetical protein